MNPKFLFCREILEMLDPDRVVLSRDTVDLGSWHSILASDPAGLGS